MSKKREEGYGHVLKYTGVFGGVQGLNILVGLVRNKLVALLLGPGGMGLASLFNTTVSFVSQATNLGISFSAVRQISELFDTGDEARISHCVQVIRSWSLLTGLVGFLLCVVAGPLIDHLTFSWGNHILHFVLLAPAVFLLAVTGGETAILKGTRRLRQLALIQVVNVWVALLLAVPVYALFGEAGIVPVIVLTGLTSMLVTIRYSYRFYPLQLRGPRSVLGEGVSMVKLGIAFTLAGIIGSGAEMLIRSFLNVEASLEEVGLYNVGYMIAITYAGIVFSAMESDYFPRLSAVSRDRQATNETVNRQMEVSMLILSPMLVWLIMLLPVLVPLLFSRDFLPVVGMAQVAVLAMYFKVMTLPVAYITLARSRSLSYLLLESLYFLVLVVAVVLGFRRWGVYGTGVAIVVAHAAEWVIVTAYAYAFYGYRGSRQVAHHAWLLMLVGAMAFMVSLTTDGWTYYIIEAALALASTAYSVYTLHQKAHLWNALMQRFRRH